MWAETPVSESGRGFSPSLGIEPTFVGATADDRLIRRQNVGQVVLLNLREPAEALPVFLFTPRPASRDLHLQRLQFFIPQVTIVLQ